MLSVHTGSTNSPMAHPTPPKGGSLGETLQYDTTFEKVAKFVLRKVHWTTCQHPSPTRM